MQLELSHNIPILLSWYVLMTVGHILFLSKKEVRESTQLTKSIKFLIIFKQSKTDTETEFFNPCSRL